MMGKKVTVEWTESENGVEYRYATEFSVHPDYVQEVGTALRYDPATKKGYQIGRRGQRIALTSYGSFGSDSHRREAAEFWCVKAQMAWDMAHEGVSDEGRA